MTRRSPLLGASALLTALTIVLTWPQALYLGTRVAAHDDPFLSMWRLAWIAHVIPDDVRHLVDGNIFYPHLRTLAYSDLTLLQGVLAIPWLWAGTNPVLVYNVLLLGGIVSSGIAMFVLARALTGSADAALVAAAIFTLVPYRIEHFMHLELQWTMWMPLTFWAAHRLFETGAVRDGVLAGVLVCLQLLSCVYYGAYLGIMVGVLSVLLAAVYRRTAVRALSAMALGGLIAVATAAVYLRPYVANATDLGARDEGQIGMFSAQLASYVTAPAQNWLWGWTSSRFIGDELHLFPGVVAVALAAFAFALRPKRRLVAIYALMVVVAVELSLGLNGAVYPWLLAHVWPLHGFRAPARFAILACCALSVLAGFGFLYLQQTLPGPRARRALFVAALVAVGVECGSAPMHLTDVPRSVPDIYRFLRSAPDGVVLELPIQDWNLAPDYMYWSTFHWHPLVNGYSGYEPPDYMETMKRLEDFPDDSAIERLRDLNVRYIVVHQTYYKQRDFSEMMVDILKQPALIPSGRYRDVVGDAHLFELAR